VLPTSKDRIGQQCHHLRGYAAYILLIFKWAGDTATVRHRDYG